jgi:hypothetical protein
MSQKIGYLYIRCGEHTTKHLEFYRSNPPHPTLLPSPYAEASEDRQREGKDLLSFPVRRSLGEVGWERIKVRANSTCTPLRRIVPDVQDHFLPVKKE